MRPIGCVCYSHVLYRENHITDYPRSVRNNETCRQKALEKSSRRARHRLELTRQMEKVKQFCFLLVHLTFLQDAVDAKELINHTKNLLRTNTGRKTCGRRGD